MATQPAQTWQPLSAPQPDAPAPPTNPANNPMATHVKIISILEIVWGVLAAILAIVFLFAFGIGSAATKAGGAPSFVTGMLAGMGMFLGILAAGLAVLAIVGGVKLLNHKRSGKTLTFIVAVISLISFPFGTAFGVYSLIILTREDTNRLLVD